MKKVASIVLNDFKNDARVLKEAITLQKNDYFVMVIALHSDKLLINDEVSGIKVYRIKLMTKKLPKLLFVQVFKYIEFFLKSARFCKKMDIIHCNDLAPLPIAVFTKIFLNKNIKIVYDAHEYQTERNGLRGIRKVFSEITEKILIKIPDQIITVSEGIAQEYKDKYNIKKPAIIYNCPFYVNDIKSNIFREKFGIAKDKTIFLYQGGLYKGRGLEITLSTFSKISKHNVLVVIGFGQLEHLVKQYADKYENVFFHEAVSTIELLSYTASADIGLCLIENTSLSYYYSMPNKYFEYSMVGLPLIVNNLYELEKITQKYNNGWIIDLTEESLSKTIEHIGSQNISEINVKSLNAKKLASDYNWENQERNLLKLYNELY
ncbi:glycosyltransferase [Sutcliffiella rhizosphaerae]|uniref:Glycosyltransferase n=1 Tax=Sutcliffiella rhizosphaerae TaxID=2880967 RepID=A0ABN8A9A8_9BACI|nr:glycosyltransferase [Sutcliffiella rhizosphaerae]CAG9620202.1 hypothetical protein BACCIP111883_00970 [Sutcliffiella rhizosphaerae]